MRPALLWVAASVLVLAACDAFGGFAELTLPLQPYAGDELREALEATFDEYGDRRYHWGVFAVDGDRIEVERWYPGDGPRVPAVFRAGRVVDDTTFVLTSSSGTETRYRFRASRPKPDSTSAFLP